MLTVFGACAVTFMMLMYALERRNSGFILAFAFGCALSSAYGFLAGTWPFGAVEVVWALVALNRYRTMRVSPPSIEGRRPWSRARRPATLDDSARPDGLASAASVEPPDA